MTRYEIEHIEATPRDILRSNNGAISVMDWTITVTLVASGADALSDAVATLEERLTEGAP